VLALLKDWEKVPLKKEPPKKGALKWNTQATTAKARGRQEPAYALIRLIQLLYVSSSGRQA